MVYAPEIERESLREKSQAISRTRQTAVALIGGFLAADFVTTRLKPVLECLQKGAGGACVDVGAALLLVTTMVLTGLWIWVTESELNQLFRWVHPRKTPVVKDKYFTAGVFVLAMTLIALWHLASRPTAFAAVYALLLLVDNVLAWMRRAEMETIFRDCREHLERAPPDDEHRRRAYGKALVVMKDYYLCPKHKTRLAVLLVLAVIAFTLSLVGILSRCWTQCLLVAVMLGGELTIQKMRKSRDERLQDLDDQLAEQKARSATA